MYPIVYAGFGQVWEKGVGSREWGGGSGDAEGAPRYAVFNYYAAVRDAYEAPR